MSDLLSFVISYGWLFLLFGLGSIGNRSLGGVGVFCLIIGLLWVLTLIWFIISIATLPKENSPPANAPPKPPKPPQQPKHSTPSRQNITSADTTVLKVDPPGNIFKAAGLIQGSYVDYEIDYDVYQKELDEFLKHGVIPGVEATTESCKKTWGMMYELFIGREFEENGCEVQYNGIESGIKDSGIDLIVHKSHNEVTILQCKYWRDTLVDSDVVSRMCGARELFYYRYCRGNIEIDIQCTIVTSSQLTAYAKQFAKNQTINVIENITMNQYSIPWVKGFGEKFYLPWDSNYIKVPKEKYFVSVFDAVSEGYKIRGCESDVFRTNPWHRLWYDIYERDFDVWCRRLCRNIEDALSKAVLPVDTLGRFVTEKNLDAYEALHEYLQENSLDDLDCGNLWIDYLTAECVNSLSHISQKGFTFFVQTCEQDYPECLPEEVLLEKFLEYCRMYEKTKYELKVD